MNRDIWLDPDTPSLTSLERQTVIWRNANMSWASMVEITGKTKTTHRGFWDNACRKIHGHGPTPLLAAPRHEDSTIGNEQTMRGIPITGRGVGGTMRGTNPGHKVA